MFGKRKRFEADMAEEMRFHVEARSADLIRRGHSPAEATRMAGIEFGGTERYKEEGREAGGWRLIDRLRADLRFTLRTLRKSPMFATVATLMLALGIGANAVVFSIVNSVLLKPLPYRDPDRIYSIRTYVPKFAHVYPDVPVNGRHFMEWRTRCAACENLTLIYRVAFNLGGAGEPQRVDGLMVTAQLFPLLGLNMQLGRPFDRVEEEPGANRVIVISDALWRRSFGADPSVVGRKVTWNQIPVEIVGVLPPGFRFPKGEQMGAMLQLPEQVDVLRPLGQDLSRIRVGGNFSFAALLKLKPNVQPADAVAEMNQPLAEFANEAKQEMQVRLYPLKSKMTDAVRRPLWLLLGAASTLLLIVCVNLGNLMMARAAGRQREWAVRTSLGASRAALFRQVLTEPVTLALAGGALGIGLATASVDLLSRLAPLTLPRLDEVTLDWRVLLFTLLLSAAAGALCSLAPLWRMLRGDPQKALSASSQRTTDSVGERRARNALVSFEVALSMMLAAAAGLLIVSFARVMSVDKGFESEHALTFQVALPEGRFPAGRRNQFHTELLQRLAALPGVTAAGMTSQLPLQGEIWVSQLRRTGDTRDFNDVPQANFRFISPDYFQAVGTRIQRGRSFEGADRGRKVVVISERAARVVFPNENPVGQSIHYNDESEPGIFEIVGVAADVKTSGLEAEPPLMAYLPFWRLAPPGAAYVVRASGDPSHLISAVRSTVAGLDRELPIHRVRTIAQIVESAVATRRLQTLLAAGFGVAGVILACLGVFGVVSYGVSRRTGEIGIRMALGATRTEVIAMVVRESMRPVIAGLIGGVAAALALGQLLSGQLFGVSPRDPAVLGLIALAVCCAALAASYWPARRAARIEPIQALRWE
jgi:predicted permease